MRLIVGLGNPGSIYADSRHNIGFSVIKSLAAARRAIPKRDSGSFSLSATVKISGQSVVLAMPLTYMNLSGLAVAALRKKYKIELSDLLIVCDDLDLEFGRIKLKGSGSSGGHHGLDSIIDSLHSQNFSRLRLGIDRPHKNIEASDYVLSPFTKKEKPLLEETIGQARDCCEYWIREGIEKSMNIFNQKKTQFTERK